MKNFLLLAIVSLSAQTAFADYGLLIEKCEVKSAQELLCDTSTFMKTGISLTQFNPSRSILCSKENGEGALVKLELELTGPYTFKATLSARDNTQNVQDKLASIYSSEIDQFEKIGELEPMEGAAFSLAGSFENSAEKAEASAELITVECEAAFDR